MKKLLFLTFLMPLFLTAQILSIDSASLNFGTTMVGSTDSALITVKNNSNASVPVYNIKFYTIYDDQPFSASPDTFTLAANGTQAVWVYFSPIQNILHQSTLVVQHNETSGHEALALQGQGRFPNTYYSSTENLNEQALKNALKTKIGQGYISLTYTPARDSMYATIDNKNGVVECVYTGRTATFNTRTGANSNNFNCEHTYPQGKFNSIEPMRSDIHHLFPTDVTANSTRGNLPFGLVSNSTWSVGGSKADANTFEPRNQQKGKTARAMMYFVIRYQDYQNFFSSQQNILKSWHSTYPVDSIETRRNNDIFAVQNNRNPFVDYPQLEKRITNFVSNSVAPAIGSMDVLQTAVDFGIFLNQTPDTFNYRLVNTGNQTISFSNFALSNNTILNFGNNSGTNTSLAPGNFLTVQLIVQTQHTTNLNENLTFNTSLPFPFSSFSIPIRGNSVITKVDELTLENQIRVYPIPLKDQLYIRVEGNHLLDIRLLDVLGKEMDLEFLNSNSNNKILNTGQLTKGLYFLELTEGENRVVKKLIKTN